MPQLYSHLQLARQSDPVFAPDERLLAAVRAALGDDPDCWDLTHRLSWAVVTPRGRVTPRQGWKLHVAASTLNALATLEAAAPVLVEARTAFKFANSIAALARMNDLNADRAMSGKFITVYPSDGANAVVLAEQLDARTRHLQSPRVLSDAPLRQGSNVSYRYGGFRLSTRFGANGLREAVIHDDAGRPVPDERAPFYHQPDWVASPFPPLPPEPDGDGEGDEGGSSLLEGRYQLKAALKHANKGGVYAGLDLVTGREVVVKEGRPHIGYDERGEDARTRVRREAETLRGLADTGVVPAVVDLFDSGGHAFLVQERLQAQPLRAMVAQHLMDPGPRPSTSDDAGDRRRSLVASLVATVEAIHARGVLLVDLSANNVMVSPEGEVRLVDLELAVRAGAPPTDRVVRSGTRAYAPPEQWAGEPLSAATDHFGLAAIIAYIATGEDPLVPTGPHLGPAGTTDGRGALLAHIGNLEDAALVDHELASLARQHAVFARALRASCPAHDPRSPGAPAPATPGERHDPPHSLPWDETRLGDLVPAGVRYLVGDLGRRPDGGWFGRPCGSSEHDPLSIQTGAAGVGLALCRALPLVDDDLAPQVVATIRVIAGHALERCGKGAAADYPAGLYFGSTGVAWFLLDASQLLGEPAWARQAARLLGPVTTPLCGDITHGLAGRLLTLLHASRITGNTSYVEQAAADAHLLSERRTRTEEGLTVWANDAIGPGDGYFLGFAHGVAGIAYALRCVASVTSHGGLAEVADDAVETLTATASWADDSTIAVWPNVLGGRPAPPFWCYGSAGIGTTLCRVGRDDDRDHQRLVVAAARAGWAARWNMGTAQCHGLAGAVELLLDLRDRTTSDGERELDDTLEALWRRSVWSDGLPLVVDQAGVHPSAGYNTGLAGIVSLLVRVADPSVGRALMTDWALVGGEPT